MHNRGVALLVCMIAIWGMMVFFTISSYTNKLAFRPEFCTDLGQGVNGPRQTLGPDADKAPTLAPPRHNVPSVVDNNLHVPSIGQTVYVQVESDHAEIEVGWAHSELVER